MPNQELVKWKEKFVPVITCLEAEEPMQVSSGDRAVIGFDIPHYIHPFLEQILKEVGGAVRLAEEGALSRNQEEIVAVGRRWLRPCIVGNIERTPHSLHKLHTGLDLLQQLDSTARIELHNLHLRLDCLHQGLKELLDSERHREC
jgi:hypothetical protein